MLFQLIFERFFFLNHSVIVKISIFLNSATRKISFFASGYYISESADRSRRNKAYYRKQLVKLILRSLHSNKPLPKVSLLTTSQLPVSAWNEVRQTTIVNCLIRKFESLLNRDKVEKCKQVKITSYFVNKK